MDRSGCKNWIACFFRLTPIRSRLRSAISILAFDETVFGRYRRQLQGARVLAHREKGQVAAFGAVVAGGNGKRGGW